MTETEIEEAAKFPSPNGPGHHEFKVTQVGDVTEVKFGPQKHNRGRGSAVRKLPSSASLEEDEPQNRSKTRTRAKTRPAESSETTERPNYPENFPIKPNYPERKGNYNKKPILLEKPTFSEAPNYPPKISSMPFPEITSSSPQPFVKRKPVKVTVKKIPMTSDRGSLPIKYMDTSLPPKPEKSTITDSPEPQKKFKPPETFLQMRNKAKKQAQDASQDGSNKSNNRQRKRKKPQDGTSELPVLIRKTKQGSPDKNNPPKPPFLKPSLKAIPTRLSTQPSFEDEIIGISPVADSAFEKPKKNTFDLTEVIPMKINEENSNDQEPILFHKSPRKIKTTTLPIVPDERPNHFQSVTVEDFGSRNPGSVLTKEEKVVLNQIMQQKPTSPTSNYKRKRPEPKPRRKPAKLMEQSEVVPNRPTPPMSLRDQSIVEVTTKRPRKRPTKSTVPPEAPTNPTATYNWDDSNEYASHHGKQFDWNDYEAARDAWRSGPVIPSFPVHPTLPAVVYPTSPTFVFSSTSSPIYQTTPSPPNFEFNFSAGIERQPGFVSYHVQTPRYPTHEMSHFHETPQPPPHRWNLVSHKQQPFHGHYATSHQSMVMGHSGNPRRTIHDFVIHHRY